MVENIAERTSKARASSPLASAPSASVYTYGEYDNKMTCHAFKERYGWFSSAVYLLHNAGVVLSLVYSLDEGASPSAVLFGFAVCALVSLCVYFKRLMWLLVPWCGILIWAMSKELVLRDGCEVMIAAICLVAISAVLVCRMEFRRFRTRRS